MRSLLMYITENRLYNMHFTLNELESFDPQIKALTSLNDQFFSLLAKMFSFDVQNQHQN